MQLSNAAASAAADAVLALLDGGTLEIRTGAAPATADDADSGTLLAALELGTPAFAAAANGVAAANAITDDSAADATGAPAHFRCKTAGGAVVFQGSASASGGGGELELSAASIVAGAAVGVTTLTYTQPKQV